MNQDETGVDCGGVCPPCVVIVAETCYDGELNQDETGTDCGGVCPACPLRTFYVSSSTGNDSNTGTSPTSPWRTLQRVNSQTFMPGDSILFKRGETFRGSIYQTERGTATNRITYGAYGTGNKPLILSSADLSATTAWTQHSTNIWRTTATLGTDQNDISNMVFNNEMSVGVKVASLAECNSQGKFFYDPSTHLLYIYSTINPALYYIHIEACGAYGIGHGNFYFYNSAYITVQNLDFRYSSAAGIEFQRCDNVIVEHCDVSWIGGEYLDAARTIRLGNGISLWQNNSNFDIRYNKVSQCYDAGISPQGGGIYTQRNINIYYNIISDCWYSYEVFTYTGSTIDNVNFDNNVCLNAGNSWSAAQRPDKGNGRHVISWDWGGNVTNSHVRNNIFKNSTNTAIRYNNAGTDLKYDHNLYNVSVVGYVLESINYTTLAQWQSATLQDNHSISGNPLFVSSSDFRLQSSSPAIDKGVAIPGLTRDFNGNPIIGLPDIGAFESPYVIVPTCYDGELNQDETGIDCGGVCPACPLRTFYVSSSTGNDSNSGTSPTAPWRTLQRVNSQTFMPGDAVFLKRGDVWQESLQISSSGNSTSPITFSVYGTGNKPVISGFTTVTGWTNETNG
ncbi:MAG: right-handed parallel beta-helix repeat-containing protein, partial [Candidatus Woesearchaeota archaeon]